MNVASVFLGILFVMLGVLCFSGVILNYLNPWKALPKEEKDKIRIKPLCRNAGELITLFGVLFLIVGLWSGFQQHSFAITMIAWLVIAIFDILYVIKSSHYHKK